MDNIQKHNNCIKLLDLIYCLWLNMLLNISDA
jgi:hypothetical protein